MVDETQVTSPEEQGEQMVGPLQREPAGLEGGSALGRICEEEKKRLNSRTGAVHAERRTCPLLKQKERLLTKCSLHELERHRR